MVASFFEDVFGHAPDVVSEAPGRIEVIGNHLDYNGGLVLGAAVDRHVQVALRLHDSPRIRLHSAGFEAVEVRLDAVAPQAGEAAWANYPLGVLHVLREVGLTVPTGFDLAMTSTLPAGAGLSSSAAVELATAVALAESYGGTFDRLTLARLGRRAENEFVGMPCGILDQGVVAFGQAGHLVLVDARHETFTPVPLPEGVVFWIFNTHHKHALVDSLYAERHRACQAARDRLAAWYPGLTHLADVTPEQVEQHRDDLPGALYRRARHVAEEQARVEVCRAALAAGDLDEAGRLLTASHASSRDWFENSTPALDALVEILTAQAGVYGARLTGGGFGGAVMALTQADFDGAEAVAARYRERAGAEVEVLRCETAEGVRLLKP